MTYVSTRGQAPVLPFADAMRAGLAADGGLYVPQTIPTLSPADLTALSGVPYEEAAFRVMAPFVGDSFDEPTLRRMIADAYAPFRHAARVPLVQLAPTHWLMELHHGPTLAFKDVAMQLIGQLFAEHLRRTGERICIVGATSGDTGSAAIEAFRGLAGTDVVILYPHGRVSEVQRRQMTTPPEANVHAFAVDGDFDDCQALVKAMFADRPFADAVGLAGVNSINWARVLAQVVYYVTSAVALGAPDRAVSFCVPTGNFGDIYAGSIARAMGVPIERLVIATNSNDILHRTLATGRQQATGVVPTISPSMDIQVSSNFERALFDAHGGDAAAVRGLMSSLRQSGGFDLADAPMGALRATYASGRADEPETSAEIARTLRETGQLVCPHTAVGLHVARSHLGPTPMVTLATAHAAKFPDAVEAATGIRPALPPHMADLYDRPERVTRIGNDLAALEALIRERLAR